MAERYDKAWQLATLRENVTGWNLWCKEHPDIKIDLYGVDLNGTDLAGADLYQADLTGANLRKANLRKADLSGADLRDADLRAVDLRWADLRGADLTGADLSAAALYQADLRRANLRTADLTGANLSKADLSGANLRRADLSSANLTAADLHQTNLSAAHLIGSDLSRASCVETDFTGATLTGCRIYGTACWEVGLDKATQQDLCITARGQAEVTVDNLKVAQCIYLLLNTSEIREEIAIIAKKVALIVGHFAQERKVVLDALRDELRARTYLPVVVNIASPASRDLTRTISTLAHQARFVIADLTLDTRIPQELAAVVPHLSSVPIQPLIQEGDPGYALCEPWKQYPWVLDTYRYQNQESLLATIGAWVIAPAESKVEELRNTRQLAYQPGGVTPRGSPSEAEHTL
jgi:uncharacterized protein YjbI with pentapeptide repeats